MRNVLFSLRTRTLLLDDLGLASFVGANGFRATARRQMRLEFVRDRLPVTRTRIAAWQNHALEWGSDSALSPAFLRRYTR